MKFEPADEKNIQTNSESSMDDDRKKVRSRSSSKKEKSGPPPPSPAGPKIKKSSKSEPIPGHDPLEEHARALLSKIVSADLRLVMAVDQAFDTTGFAFLFPRVSSPGIVLHFLEHVICRFDSRFEERAKEMGRQLISALRSGGGPLILPPIPPKRSPRSFGLVLPSKDGLAVILHGALSREPSDKPEWQLAQELATEIKKIAKTFCRYAEQEMGSRAVIAVEGLALSGSPDSIAILPCLGILYGAIWEALSGDDTLAANTREMPIVTWKKFFTGKGNSNKEAVKRTLSFIGFNSIEHDDESDALALVISESMSENLAIGKDTRGRLRPTRSAQATKRVERAAKKARKLEREEKRRKKMAPSDT